MKWTKYGLLMLAAALSPAALAQTRQIIQPDCVIDFVFTAAGQTAGGAGTCGNNVAGVYEWRITYKSTGFSALSLVVQSAPDNTGAPGAWVNFVGTLVGSNPNTATTQATTDLAGFNPWVRVLLTSKTGTGTITGELYGCRQPGCSIAGAAISAVIPTPVPVDGPTAAGAAPTTPPVLVAGQDGTPGLIRTLKTDAVGELIPANGAVSGADGISNSQQGPLGASGLPLYYRVLPDIFNGATNDRQFSCMFQALTILAPGTTGKIVVNTGTGKTVKICHVHETSGSTMANVTIRSGTGAQCAAGTTTIDGYIGTPGFVMDFSPLSPLKAANPNDDVCMDFDSSLTATILVIYAEI